MMVALVFVTVQWCVVMVVVMVPMIILRGFSCFSRFTEGWPTVGGLMNTQ